MREEVRREVYTFYKTLWKESLLTVLFIGISLLYGVPTNFYQIVTYSFIGGWLFAANVHRMIKSNRILTVMEKQEVN